MTFEEWRVKYWKTDVPAEIKFISAFDAGREMQNSINKDYFQAVEDALVCWEITITGNAKVDLNNLLCMEQQVCLDPAVSLDARTLIRLGRLEALRECAETVNLCAVKRHSARTACDIIRQTLAKEI